MPQARKQTIKALLQVQIGVETLPIERLNKLLQPFRAETRPARLLRKELSPTQNVLRRDQRFWLGRALIGASPGRRLIHLSLQMLQPSSQLAHFTPEGFILRQQ